jgi:hypothetical protein
MGIGRAEARDGVGVDEVRSTGFEREVGAELAEAGTLRKITSGASVTGNILLVMIWLSSRRLLLDDRGMDEAG